MMTSNQSPDARIKALPVKDFFISIITRDIKLADAVNDLIDNSVDAGRRLRRNKVSAPHEKYKGLKITVDFDENGIEIEDNCGGIDYITAKEHAFRFGRDLSVPTTEGSIGRFGVGMKRALFKMGRLFEVSSTSQNSKIYIKIDVDEWKQKMDDHGNELWEFEFAEAILDQEFAEAEWGTKIKVSKLYEPIAADFRINNFLNKLVESISAQHEQFLNCGFEILINNVSPKNKLSKLTCSEEITPIKIEKTYQIDPDVPNPDRDVKVVIIAGAVPDSVKSEAGWNVICNGRQVLRADQTNITGWDEEIEGQVRVPKAHYQFYKFRGYIFFDSKDAAFLPWNTAKSGLDAESIIFKAAKIEMVGAMRQVLDFLNKIDSEIGEEDAYLTQELRDAPMIELESIPINSTFRYPSAPNRTAKPKRVRIQYSGSIEDVEFGKDFFSVASATKVGEATLDYFLARERI